MPIRVRLDRLMVERGVTLTELSESIGITLANLSILKTNKARAVRFSTLSSLCAYLQCQPGDLLEYIEGPEEVEDEQGVDRGDAAGVRSR